MTDGSHPNFSCIRVKKRKNNLDKRDAFGYNDKGFVPNPDGILQETRGGISMAEVKLKEGESLDSALRRFKRQYARQGTQNELRKREHYEKPSVKRKKKSEAARKRKYK